MSNTQRIGCEGFCRSCPMNGVPAPKTGSDDKTLRQHGSLITGGLRDQIKDAECAFNEALKTPNIDSSQIESEEVAFQGAIDQAHESAMASLGLNVDGTTEIQNAFIACRRHIAELSCAYMRPLL